MPINQHSRNFYSFIGPYGVTLQSAAIVRWIEHFIFITIQHSRSQQSYAYGALGNPREERAYANRMNGVIRTILASGDGFTQKTPRHVLMFDHALDVLTVEGLSYGKARIISRTVEFVPLTAPYTVEGKKRRGFYFDFGRVYWNKPEGYTYKRDRTWQFNNLKPRTYK